ncbi:S41 family peptidase [Chondrinema litorale]|uniref:S41 family peptidase n=1 Tax=Chondrinema litorale TaxID=2994555 RepID=UPI002542DAEA|nr:S41 family peptidase [Chondrinema litorale]UZR93307.1 S41 family peptidase [Chondrinema litorale]
MGKAFKVVFFVVLSVFSVTLISSQSTSDRFFEIAKSLETFASLFKEVNKYYVDDVEPTELANEAVNSMLASLDPYTNYIPEDRIEDYRTMTTGEYGGIGAEVDKIDGKIIITMPLQGYAAEKAGLLIGDEIVKVNGLDISDRPLSNIRNLLKGQANSSVNLSIRRYGKDDVIDFDISYEKVREKNVPYYGMVTEDIGMIKLTDFTQKAGLEVKNALVELKAEGAQKIIFDLRGNPGGLLNEAVNITNVFLPRGSEIVSMRGKSSEWSKNYRALNEPVDTDIPLAIIVDNNSASASEIVSGVLQDYDRGVVIGERSFGKGLVQTTTMLSYNSQLKVTVAKYYIPSGRCIQEIDYSRRNDPVEDATKERKVFKTKNNRVVYDGAGIDPEINTERVVYAPITKSLIDKKLIFDYANIFRSKIDSIPAAKTFNLSDSEYNDFVAWLNDKEYGYNTKVENTLENLIASSKHEKLYEGIKSEIEELENQILKNKKDDLFKFKNEIKEVLEYEIASRYYLQKGQIEITFDDNPDILEAINILNNPTRYHELLAEPQ